ncbi:MAG: DUF2905 domain-containing protein [Burkholderiales bacterium]
MYDKHTPRPDGAGHNAWMLKWVITTLVALVLLTGLMPLLARFGLGKLPGDVTLRVRGRDIYLPFTTTIVLSALLALLARLI